ncbi:hypothetical protein Hanom_Chr12g01093151 [Helianthus anomalus]
MMLRKKTGGKEEAFCKEKGEVVRFRRSFPEDFEGKIAVEECGEGEQGLYEATVAGFQVPDLTALKALLPQVQGNVSMFVYIFSFESDILEEIVFAAGKLGALGDPSAVAGGGKAGKTVHSVVAMVGKAKKPEKLVTIPVKQKRKADTAPAGAEKKVSLRQPKAATLSTCMSQASVAAKPPTPTPPSSPPKVAGEEEKKDDGGPEVQECDQLKAKAAAAIEKIRASEGRLAKEKADFKDYKQTEQWGATASHKQVRSLTHLLSEERKLWKEACSRENEKLFRLRQENINLKAVNAALVKERPRLMRV